MPTAIATTRHADMPSFVTRSRPAPGRNSWWSSLLGLVAFIGLASLSGASFALVVTNLRPTARPALSEVQGPGEPMSRAEAALLARVTLRRLDDANRTGSYEVFRAMSAPGFQAQNSGPALAQIFAWLRHNAILLAPETGLVDTTLALETLNPQGFARIAGAVSASKGPLRYELVLERVEGDWRLFAITLAQR